jgi:pimeloyl-ACP methyl ester carboxylesterase
LPFLVADGRRLEYAWHGPPPESAPTLVFLHEGLGSVSMWRDFPESVARQAGMGALVYSRAGYGRSDPIALPRPKSYLHDEARVLGDVLDAAGVREAVLVGHSDGASIAIIYVATANDPRVRGAAVMAPHVHARDVNYGEIADARETLRDPARRAKLERHHGPNTEVAFRGWNETWLDPDFRDWSIEALLPRIAIPLLVIQGEGDEYATLDQVGVLAREAGGAVETLVLPGVGHRPFVDARDVVREAIARFARLSTESRD